MNIKKNLLVVMLLAPAACGRVDEPESANQESGAPTTGPVAEASTLQQRSTSLRGAAVSFVTPRDGAVVSSPFSVEFRVEGMDVVPAGTAEPGSGHHHILVDTDLPDMSLPIPADDAHIHFGDGSSSSELSLPPGRHTLRLLFADHLHIPHDPPVYSAPITITVE